MRIIDEKFLAPESGAKLIRAGQLSADKLLIEFPPRPNECLLQRIRTSLTTCAVHLNQMLMVNVLKFPLFVAFVACLIGPGLSHAHDWANDFESGGFQRNETLLKSIAARNGDGTIVLMYVQASGWQDSMLIAAVREGAGFKIVGVLDGLPAPYLSSRNWDESARWIEEFVLQANVARQKDEYVGKKLKVERISIETDGTLSSVSGGHENPEIIFPESEIARVEQLLGYDKIRKEIASIEAKNSADLKTIELIVASIAERNAKLTELVQKAHSCRSCSCLLLSER